MRTRLFPHTCPSSPLPSLPPGPHTHSPPFFLDHPSQEATIVCVDNSEFTRNGDYAPTRFQAQSDAVNLLAGAKTQHHPENTVGVLTTAGRTPRVLVTPTPDLGKVLNAMQDVSIEGESNLSVAVQIAQLALKHRENKNQRQRIVIFVGSPIKEDKDTLVKIAKKLKKNNVAVDIVAFGSEEENGEKLEAFHAAVSSNDNSHLVTVPPGTILSDMLFSTPIFMEEAAMTAAAQGQGGAAAPAAPRANVVDGFDYGELGVDPTLDPELALALRVSMEEEKARQAAQAQAAGSKGGEGGGEGSGSGEAAAAAGDAGAGGGGEEMMVDAMDEDALLQQALAMSMTGAGGGDAAKTPAADAPTQMQQQQQEAAPPAAPTKAGGADVAMDAIDDPELALALQMSMAETQPGEEKKEGEKEEK